MPILMMLSVLVLGGLPLQFPLPSRLSLPYPGCSDSLCYLYWIPPSCHCYHYFAAETLNISSKVSSMSKFEFMSFIAASSIPYHISGGKL